MISKEQAYEVTLNLLNSVWDSILSSAVIWKRSPQMNLRMATATAQNAINDAIEGIRGSAAELPVGSSDQDILEDIAVRLEAFKSVLASARGMAPIENADQLVSSWRIAMDRIVNNLTSRSCDIAKIPAFNSFARRLAA